jgi:hypothetical protein
MLRSIVAVVVGLLFIGALAFGTDALRVVSLALVLPFAWIGGRLRERHAPRAVAAA